MKFQRTYLSLLVLITGLLLSGCSLSSQENSLLESLKNILPNLSKSPVSETSAAQPPANKTAVLVSERGSPKQPPQLVRDFIQYWTEDNYSAMFAMISSPPANDIKQKVDFQEKWHQEKMQLLKQAEAYGISEPFNAPKIFSRRIDNVTAVEVSLKDLAVLTFQFNRDKYRWKIVKIDIAEGPVAERHRINEKFYRQLKPLFDRYYYLVDWSDWLREAEEPEALQKYWQDILGVQKQLQEISPPQEATELYKAFQEALSKLEEATRAQIKFVSLKNDLADKLKETVQTMEDINLLEERLEEQLEQSNESYMIGTMRQTLENLKEEIRTELENLQDKSYQLGEADREQLLLQFEELHRQFLSEKAVYEEFVGRTAGL